MTVTDSSGTRVHVYSYDNIYQITEVNYPPELSYLATDTTFNYDAAGNRTSVIDGSGTCNYTSNTLNQYTAAGTTSYQYDNSGNLYRDANYTYYYDPENRLTEVKKPIPPTQNLNNFSAYTKGGDAPWVADPYGFAKSGDLDDNQESWMSIQVSGSGRLSFDWRVSSQQDSDYLEFSIDGQWPEAVISGDLSWETKSYTIYGTGTHTFKWKYYKDSDGSDYDDRGYVKAVTWRPDPPAPTLAQAADSFLSYTTGGSANWHTHSNVNNPSVDWAESGAIGDSQESWLQTTVEGTGTFSFHWTVSSLEDDDYLEFYIDSQLQHAISGSVDWEEKSYTITGSGTHTLKWRYVKDGSDSGGTDCGSVDQVTWTGTIPNDPASDAWQRTITYVYDPAGRRIEKKYDDLTVLKYVYDGDHCIAEYDAYNHLRRKYIYGPGVDQPISMIESTTTYAGTYYYHFDGLGSVTALTNSSGTTVEVYEYDVYGRVGASVPAHPNRILFTGREYDKETGLYYYRARYYNPQIGRFLQTDPIGYGAGMNWYAYCGNNSTNGVDPTGLYGKFLDQDDPLCEKDRLTFAWVDDKTGEVSVIRSFRTLDDWMEWARNDPTYGGLDDSNKEDRPGWDLSNGNETVFWYIQAAIFLTTDLVGGFDLADIISDLEAEWWGVKVGPETGDGPVYDERAYIIEWNPDRGRTFTFWTEADPKKWWACPNLAALVHEIGHAYDHYLHGATMPGGETYAMSFENIARYAFYRRVPGCGENGRFYVAPRPTYGLSGSEEFKGTIPADVSHRHPDVSWSDFRWWQTGWR